MSLENLGDGEYRVIYDYGSTIIQPGQLIPGGDGNVIGLNYTNWSTFDDSNDYSYVASSTFIENTNMPCWSNGALICPIGS